MTFHNQEYQDSDNVFGVAKYIYFVLDFVSTNVFNCVNSNLCTVKQSRLSRC